MSIMEYNSPIKKNKLLIKKETAWMILKEIISKETNQKDTYSIIQFI